MLNIKLNTSYFKKKKKSDLCKDRRNTYCVQTQFSSWCQTNSPLFLLLLDCASVARNGAKALVSRSLPPTSLGPIGLTILGHYVWRGYFVTRKATGNFSHFLLGYAYWISLVIFYLDSTKWSFFLLLLRTKSYIVIQHYRFEFFFSPVCLSCVILHMWVHVLDT